MLNFIVNFIEQWLGALPKVVFAFLGALVCVMVVGLLWDRRMRLSSALMGIAAGLGIAFHSVIYRGLSALQPEQRLKMMGIAIGLAVIGMTVQAVRRVDLQRRYAVIWLGAGIGLMAASFHPGILQAMGRIAHNASTAVLGGACFFLLFLLAFHFSVAVTRLEQRYRALRERLLVLEDSSGIAGNKEMPQEQQLPSFSLASLHSLFSAESVSRTIRGTRIGAPLAIAVATLAVLAVGLAAPQAMIGDEVTHYYMLVKQAQDLSQPNFYSEIPMASGGHETRRYPHSFGWHYLGALAYLLTGGSFAGVQVYQAFFLLQFLSVAYLLAKSRGGVESRSALLYVLVLASLPLSLIFSVAFYQDVPMTAQVLTAFYLLSRRRWFFASCFMALAVFFKVTAVLFYPAFFCLLVIWERKGGVRQGLKAVVCASLIVFGSSWFLGKAINIYAQSAFYPLEKLEIVVKVVKSRVWAFVSKAEREPVNRIVEKSSAAAVQYNEDKSPETAPTIIANHPGDLRIKENYLIYGGLMIWLVIGLGLLVTLSKFIPMVKCREGNESWWLFSVGVSFLLLTVHLTRSAPDARFFLPGLPFVLLPLVEKVMLMPRPKLLITFAATLAVLQGGYVLSTTHKLRVVSPSIQAGIRYLELHPTKPRTIFMYPEGNYRLFPAPHEWYLGYRLREFWRADNNKRIEMLMEFGIGAIVIKKRLIAPVDEEITNLGVYPPQFVEELRNDDRFVKSFENDEILLVLPPAPAAELN